MSNSLSDSQLRALVSLLADRDESIAQRCRARLLVEGERVRPFLESEIATAPREHADAARAALHEWRAVAVDREIAAFAADPAESQDLFTGAMLIARTNDPDLDPAAVSERLDALAEAVRSRILIPDDPDDVAQALCSVLVEETGLRGNTNDYYHPDNSFLHRVLASGMGIPISLSVIYVLVGRRAGLAVFGVGMPGHFLVRVGESLFLDPFNRGRILRREDCLGYLKEGGFGADESLLRPTPDRLIVARMLANLQNAYKKREDVTKADRYHRLFVLVRGAATR